MSPLFTVIVIILAVLAIIDLIVGVSNDAINFLNSALGSKVAKRWIILTVAAAGILLGVLEAMGAAYVSIAWKDAIAFLVLILILIFRPTGLLGERVAEKI